MNTAEIKNQNTIEKRVEELKQLMYSFLAEDENREFIVEKRSALWLDIMKNELPEVVEEFIYTSMHISKEAKRFMLVILAKRADLVGWHDWFYYHSGYYYPEAVNAFATSPDEKVRLKVAGSEHASQETLVLLIKEFPYAVLSNPVASLELLNSYMESEYAYAIADNTSASEEMLDRLADKMTLRVAENTSTSEATQQKLISDTDGAVCRAVARKSTFGSILRKLSVHTQDSVRLLVANNRNAPIDVFAYLMEHDTDSDVRNAARKTYLSLTDPAHMVRYRMSEIEGKYRCDWDDDWSDNLDYDEEYQLLISNEHTDIQKVKIIEEYRTKGITQPSPIT